MLFSRLLRSSKGEGQVVRSAQDQAEKLLAEAFRTLGRLFGQVADLVEAERLERRGFERQGKFLKRLDGEESAPPSSTDRQTPSQGS